MRLHRTATALTVVLLGSGFVACSSGVELSAQPMRAEVLADPAGPPVRDAGELSAELVKGTGDSPRRAEAEFAALAKRYSADLPKLWVSGGATEDGEVGDHYMVFTERPPMQVFDDLSALATDTNVLVGAAASAREIRRLSRAVLASLSTHEDAFANLGAGSQRYGRSVTITYSLDPRATPKPSPGDLERWESDALQAGADEFRDGTLPVPVEFRQGLPGPRGRG
ncbi:MAG: hypothetical protein ACT4P1_15880 [Sporichthyaceae bacterium]